MEIRSYLQYLLFTKINVPSNPLYFEIEGGNHAGYGNYGVQKGDGTTTISGDEQKIL